MLLHASRLALRLTKEAEEASAIGTLDGATGGPPRVLHGFEGRITKPMVGGMRVRKTEGPRSYAPRLDKPSVSK